MSKLDEMDKKLDVLVTGQAVMSQLIEQHAKKIEEHENVLYGDGTEKPGLISKVIEVHDTCVKIKKYSVAAVSAAITGLVAAVIRFIPGLKD